MACHRASTILVTGGAGYVGSVLVRHLLAHGYRVRVLDTLLYGGGAIHSLLPNPNFEFIHGDLRDPEPLAQSIRGVRTVIHLAAIVGDAACAQDEEFSYEVNYVATEKLVDVCKGAGVEQLIFASTCSVYGANEQTTCESSAPNPISHYARTKLNCESLLLSTNNHVFRPTILRLATAFGASPRPRFDLVVNLLTARALHDRKITIFNGEQWRPFIHVTDLARAICMVLEAPSEEVSGQIFNVGDNQINLKLGEIAEIVRREACSVDVEYVDNADRRDYRVRFDKIERVLNFRARVGIAQGVREIANQFRNKVLTDHQEPIYSNCKYLALQWSAPAGCKVPARSSPRWSVLRATRVASLRNLFVLLSLATS